MDDYIEKQLGKEHEYVLLRDRKLNADAQLRRYFWIQLILSIVLFGLAIFAAADMSRSDDLKGPGKFFWSMNAAGIQIILGVISLVFCVLAGYRKRWATFVLIALYLGMMLFSLSSPQVALRTGNAALAVFGIGLNVWVQRAFNTDEELKEYPGYPLFLMNAEKADYHPSLVVTARKSSDRMESIGGDADAAQQTEMPALTAPADIALSDIEASAQQNHRASERTLSAPDASLEQFGAGGVQSGRAAEELPALSPDAVLSDMTAERTTPHPDSAAQLPDPEEVRARLAAMRDARLRDAGNMSEAQGSGAPLQ